MARRRKAQDPHAEREAARYDNPIPSREYILELLTDSSGPMDRQQIQAALGIQDEEQEEALRRRLRAMERDGQLLRNRRGGYGVAEKMGLIRGRVQAHRDGFGFVLVEDGEDLYLNGRQMSTVFNGDEVLVRVSGIDRRGRREGTIVEVIKRHTERLVGRLQKEGKLWFVVPDNPRVNHDLVVEGDLQGAKVGDYVTVALTEQPGWHRPPRGEIEEVLGAHMAPGMETEVAIRSYDIPHVWPEALLAEAEALPAEPREADKKKRIDLRNLPLVTIDGEDAKDFDDAVYCEKKRWGGWRLWVAIADVSHYVQAGSAMDREASKRGNSVYFPDRVVPMFPEALSNGLCSLMPEVDRLCMVCEMTISRAGKLTGYQFYEGVLHSHARLTYNKVWAILSGDEALRERYQAVVPHLENLHALYKVLRQAREQRGAIDFETTETRIVFGPERKIEEIVPVQRNDAHKLIEECMLAANVATARFLEKHEVPALYRVHEGPSGEKLYNLRKFLGELGLDLSGGETPSPRDYQQLLQQVEGRPDAHIIQTMMLRSLKQAVYQPENKGHFGLHYAGYAHFTSPIRRYPDLLVHRALRSVIRSRKRTGDVQRVKGAGTLDKAQIYPYNHADLTALGEQCSMTERRADEATRDVVAWLKCEYLQDRVGEVFPGVVAAVTGFGLFVELSDLYVEGLVHVTALERDYYNFDPAKQRLIGERTGTSFRLGDEVTVQLARVDLDERKIDLEMVEAPKRRRKGGKRAAKGGPSTAKKTAKRGPGAKSSGKRGAKRRRQR